MATIKGMVDVTPEDWGATVWLGDGLARGDPEVVDVVVRRLAESADVERAHREDREALIVEGDRISVTAIHDLVCATLFQVFEAGDSASSRSSSVGDGAGSDRPKSSLFVAARDEPSSGIDHRVGRFFHELSRTEARDFCNWYAAALPQLARELHQRLVELDGPSFSVDAASEADVRRIWDWLRDLWKSEGPVGTEADWPLPPWLLGGVPWAHDADVARPPSGFRMYWLLSHFSALLISTLLRINPGLQVKLGPPPERRGAVSNIANTPVLSGSTVAPDMIPWTPVGSLQRELLRPGRFDPPLDRLFERWAHPRR